MDRRPGGIFEQRAAAGVEQSIGDEVVEGSFDEVQRERFVGWLRRRLVHGGREGGREQAGLGTREVEVGLPDGAQPETCAGWRLWSGADVGHAHEHALGEEFDGGVAYGGEQGVAIGEVAVGRVGNDADQAGDLAQDDGVWSARAGELEAGVDEGCADGAAGARTASGAARRSGRLVIGHVHGLSMLVDSVHIGAIVNGVHII